MVTRWAPIAFARGSASFSDFRTDCSKSEKPKSASRRGRHVDLDVEAAKLGLKRRICNRSQDLSVAHGRLAVGCPIQIAARSPDRPLAARSRTETL